MAWPGPPPPGPWRQRWDRLTAPLIEALFPPRCGSCHAALSGPDCNDTDPAGLCHTCSDELPRIDGARCQTCGEPFDGALDHPFNCWNCEGRNFAFAYATAGYRADGVIRTLIHRFKYDRRLELRGLMGTLLLRSLEDPRLSAVDLTDWLLVPVPLHFTRRRQREYNQSWELCTSLSQLTGLRATSPLSRVRRTQAQASLNRHQRLENLRGAFQLKPQSAPSLAGRSLLLVDDVLTTGATTHECARVLRQQGGVEKVVVITVGRG